MSVPTFAVAGWKNSGKTTLVERLVRHFTEAGYVVGTVKRSHDAFLMDVAGTDTERHRRAGASQVAMVGPNGWTMAKAGGEPDLATVLAAMADCHLVIVEGGKRGSLPLIEVVAEAGSPRLRATNEAVFAVATDVALKVDVPVFARDDVRGLAELATRRIGLA